MPDVARSQIIGGGISDASPFGEGYIPVISSSTPPEVTQSIMKQVPDGGGFIITASGPGGTGLYFSDGGGPDGMSIQSDQPNGGGVYVTDYSQTGVYVEDLSDDGSGVYILTDDVAPTHYNSGIYIVQQSTDSAGVFILDESTSGNGGVFIETDNANIKLTANGANGKIVFDANTVIRFGDTGLAIPMGEVGADFAVWGAEYASLAGYSHTNVPLIATPIIQLYGQASAAIWQARRLNGTFAAPTAIVNNDVIGQWGAEGYDASGGGFNGSSTRIRMRATENFGAAAHGSLMDFAVTPNGTVAIRVALTIIGTGEVQVAAPSASGQSLLITGFGGAGVPVVRFNGTTNGAAAQAGTLLNAPVAGNPGHWLPVSIAGTVRYIPCW